jgi:hypothetical protein
MYDINPQDFAHHVRHATSWNDLGVRCGCSFNEEGTISSASQMHSLKQKVSNMRLSTEHFFGQQPQIPDDVFKTIIRESDCMNQIIKKCVKGNGISEKEKILKRIADLDIDISHFKIRKTCREYPRKIMDAINDETFKMLVKNNRTWTNLGMTCGYSRGGGEQKTMAIRIEKLGLNTNHFDNDVITSDNFFLVDSQYACTSELKKRLVRDFDRPYECNACKNVNFTKRDGVLMWND